jgi:hypothetical protein
MANTKVIRYNKQMFITLIAYALAPLLAIWSFVLIKSNLLSLVILTGIIALRGVAGLLWGKPRNFPVINGIIEGANFVVAFVLISSYIQTLR